MLTYFIWELGSYIILKAAGAICGGYFYVMGGETDVSVGCGGALRDCWRINIEGKRFLVGKRSTVRS